MEEELSQFSVLENYLQGRFSMREVCTRLGVHRSTLWRKIQRMRKEGRAGLTHGLKGQPSNNSKPEAMKSAIRTLWHENYKQSDMSVLDFYTKIVRELTPTISYSTVLRWLKNNRTPNQAP